MAEAIVKTEKENTWSMIKLGLILAAYAVVACALLAVVNNFTAPKIADNQSKKVSAAQVTGPTYDQGSILIGIKTDGTVTGLKFLKLTDSPGFGLKANDATFKLPNGKTFYGQFQGKNAKSGFKVGENFDAISGATITSVAVSSLINEGTKNLFAYFDMKGVKK